MQKCPQGEDKKQSKTEALQDPQSSPGATNRRPQIRLVLCLSVSRWQLRQALRHPKRSVTQKYRPFSPAHYFSLHFPRDLQKSGGHFSPRLMSDHPEGQPPGAQARPLPCSPSPAAEAEASSTCSKPASVESTSRAEEPRPTAHSEDEQLTRGSIRRTAGRAPRPGSR